MVCTLTVLMTPCLWCRGTTIRQKNLLITAWRLRRENAGDAEQQALNQKNQGQVRSKKAKKKYFIRVTAQGGILSTPDVAGPVNSYPLFLWITMCITQ
ncbi:hypothetical protein COO59_02270 [Mixta theicola]|uniref:Uncharacterized protein n=1 Tax=Mixta theicola TaxID=1458355 RepID=A0A2K1QF36_9GAMM|nr:hypothetical protein COO59_02270 [Mixta theicola]